MRFTVDDHFAIRLAEHLYPLLLEKRQALPRALQRACEKALTPELRSRAPLSMFTPILFGRLAGTLAFTVPSQTRMPERFLARTGLFSFPPEPARATPVRRIRILPMSRGGSVPSCDAR